MDMWTSNGKGGGLWAVPYFTFLPIFTEPMFLLSKQDNLKRISGAHCCFNLRGKLIEKFQGTWIVVTRDVSMGVWFFAFP